MFAFESESTMHATPVRWSRALEADLEPLARRSHFQITAEIRQSLDLGGQHGGLRHALLTGVLRASRTAPREQAFAIAAAGDLLPQYLALADQARGELRRSAVLACRAAKDQRIAAVLHNRLGIAAVGAGDLRSGLKAQAAASSKFAQPRERVL